MVEDRRTQHVMNPAPAGRAPPSDDLVTQLAMPKSPAVGHVEIVEGPGTGRRLPVYSGTNAIGRDPEPKKNRIVVDFGDPMIGRSQHAFIVYDAARRIFGVQGNGHPNPVLLNGEAVTALVRLSPSDRLTIGRTTFKLLA